MALLLLVLLPSCRFFRKKDDTKGKPLARVKDAYLYESDIKSLIKNTKSAKDSADLVNSYIDSWIRKQMMLDKAQTYLPADQQDLEQQVRDYKESLLIFRYENELTRQKLDTTVTDSELLAYYNQFKDNFDLKEDIVQFNYIKVPKDAPKIDSARVLLKSPKENDQKKLASYCYQYAKDFSLKDTMWYDLSRVYKQIPIAQDALENLARNKMSGEVEDSDYIYLLKVNNFRGRTELAPPIYVKEDIRKIVLNSRKIDLISKTYDNLYKDGLKNGDLEKY